MRGKAGGSLKHSTGLMKIVHMRHVMDFREALITSQEREFVRQLLETCQKIRDVMGQEEYDAWWEATPEDNKGFEAAAKQKLQQLQAT